MKKTLLLVLSLMLSVGLLAGCGNNEESTTDEGASSGDTVKIGLNYELSGATATYGEDSVKGIELAIEEINANGGIDGKTIELVKIDNKSETSEATSVATKLIDQEGVVSILGPATSGAFKATIPVAESKQVPIISASATADDVTTNDGEAYQYVFRTCFSDSYQGSVMATFASENLGATKAVIIQDTSSDYAKGLAENFQTTFEEAGGEIVASEGYVSGDTDFKSILTKIKNNEFDVIYLPGYYSEVGLIVKQARDLGIDAPVLGGDGFDSPTLLELAGADALNNIYFTNHYSAVDQDPKVVEFQAAFKEKYNTDASAFNATGYDLGYFIADAIDRADSTDPQAIQEALASTENFEGVTGTITVDELHNAIKSIVVIGLENGVQASAEKISAETTEAE
ncbi:MAG TPA: ABC transporter substrate-binding protein [Firmicutes bacterium]|nr:ABC transporter substrate-binding protein [Bacillota bacterium]